MWHFVLKKTLWNKPLFILSHTSRSIKKKGGTGKTRQNGQELLRVHRSHLPFPGLSKSTI